MIQKTPIIFEKSISGKVGCTIPKSDVPEYKIEDFIDSKSIRDSKAVLPEVSEPEVMRHFVNLSVKNHHIDKDIFPLGFVYHEIQS